MTPHFHKTLYLICVLNPAKIWSRSASVSYLDFQRELNCRQGRFWYGYGILPRNSNMCVEIIHIRLLQTIRRFWQFGSVWPPHEFWQELLTLHMILTKVHMADYPADFLQMTCHPGCVRPHRELWQGWGRPKSDWPPKGLSHPLDSDNYDVASTHEILTRVINFYGIMTWKI